MLRGFGSAAVVLGDISGSLQSSALLPTLSS